MQKAVLRRKSTGEPCPHTDLMKVKDSTEGKCQECDITRSLRLCATCGHVGCCESENAHGKRHADESGHPIILQLPVTPTSFVWCYACGDYLI